MTTPKLMAELLARKLTGEEFAQLIDLFCSDAGGALLEEASVISYAKHPEYGPTCASCRHPEMEHSGTPSSRSCYCCDCVAFGRRVPRRDPRTRTRAVSRAPRESRRRSCSR